jgi:hypothetical protein
MGVTIIESMPGRIPFTAIDSYARRFGIVGEAFDHLLFFIGELDQEYLSFMAEKSRERWQQMQKK